MREPVRTINRLPGRAFIAAWYLFVAATLAAQTPVGSIRGRVLDLLTQEPVPGAIVVLLRTTQGAAADDKGQFAITGVPVGTYQLRASAVGREPTIVADVVVAAGRSLDLVIRLEEFPVGLKEVEVRGKYFQKTPDAPVSAQKLSYEEIRRSPGGFEDVVRTISVFPGVAQALPGRNDLVVRGGAPSENLFVVDNIEIPNINHFGTLGSGGGPLSYINLDFVRETAFSTGGFGVRYGDRLSSVLSIDLQDGGKDALGGKGTIAATQFGLNLHGPLNEESSFIFSARRSYLDFIFKAAGFSFVPEYWDFLGRVSYRLGGSNTLTLLGIGAIDDVSFSNDNADKRLDNSRILGTAQRQYVGGASWQHLFSSGFSLVTLGRTYVSSNGAERDTLLYPVFASRTIEEETGVRVDFVFKLHAETELSFGAQAKQTRFTSTLALPGFATTFGETLSVNIADKGLTGYKTGGYIQFSRHFFRDFELTLGARLDYFSLIDDMITLSPRGSLTYLVSPVTTLAFSAGVYRQNPSTLWLAANPANRQLHAARADQYIISAEHLLEADLRLRLEGFLKRYSDYPASIDRPYLVLANTGDGYGGAEDNFTSFGFDRLVSAGTGLSRGVEILLQKKLSEIPAYGLLSLSLMRTTFTGLDRKERPGAYDQEAILNVGGGYQFDERWEASMKFRFSSGEPYTPFRPNGTQDVSAYNTLRLRNAHSLDLRVDRRWNFSAWNLIAYVDIQNVYNNKYSGSVRWNARENRAEFDESAIGILPSIGVSAEF